MYIRAIHLYHVGGSFTVHSIMQARLIAGGNDTKEGRQTVFFSVVDPLGDEPDKEYQEKRNHERYNTKVGGE